MPSILVAQLLCRWDAPLTAERQKKASENQQFLGPDCYMVKQTSATFSELENLVFYVLRLTPKVSLCLSLHLGVTASAHAGGH